jgi:5-methylcytosine-specific restriction enzyme B
MTDPIDTRVRESISAALQSWDRSAVGERIPAAEDLRRQFVERFPLEAWPQLPLESYALGQTIDGGTVCWWLEFHTRDVSSMSGGSARKHLIWLADSGWRFPSRYESVEEAWDAVRGGFVDLFRHAADGNFDELGNPGALEGAPALRTKALYMYFPDEFVPVNSKTHMLHFIQALGGSPQDPSAVLMNRQLLQMLRDVPDLADLSTQELGYFLYHWADPQSALRVVKIAPGERARYWPDCLDRGFICVGWDEVGDLSQFESKEAFREAFREHFPYDGNESQVTRKSNELWTLMELEPGDKVIANRGVGEVLAIGTVTNAGYQWRPDRTEFQHTLGVDWDTSQAREIQPIGAWRTTTVSKVSAAQYKAITGTTAATVPIESDRIYVEIEQAVARRSQVILYGPPGTGKTYLARRAAVWLLEGGSQEPAATALLADDTALYEREDQLRRGHLGSRVWFMVANPSNWSWSELFPNQSVWWSGGRIKKYFPMMRNGDLVVGYEASPTKRVVALAYVTGEYGEVDADDTDEDVVWLEPISEVTNGVTFDELNEDPVLSGSEPVHNRMQGSLFSLSSEEANRLMHRLIERDPSLEGILEWNAPRLTWVTFHPSYSYEDFVEGFRPTPTDAGGLNLELTDGIFKRVCEAAADDPDRSYVIVIDEINRGNIPKIFGELITLIEKDKRGTLSVRLSQSGDDFVVPPNLFILATMNTADRSIHLLDTALRRRFAFVELMPDTEPLQGATVGGLALDVFLENLNDRVRQRVGREKQVGHALFFDDGSIVDSPEAFAGVFRHELLPLLQEYLYEDYTELAEVLGPVIDAATERPASIINDPDRLCEALAEHFGAIAGA